MAGNEDDLLAWLRRSSAAEGGRLIGDDAALLPEAESWAVTVDSQVEGVHFVPGLDPATLAARLLAVNLSDLAAMGARPAYGFLALAAPDGFDHRRFFRVLLRAAKRHEVELAGGDLAASPHLTASLTLLGRRADGGRWLTRGGAAPGESLWLGGSVGEAAAGGVLVGRGAAIAGRTTHLPEGFEASAAVGAAARRAVRRHLLPRPQLALGHWLACQDRGGAIDVSDGLARDLHRLCRESGVGAEVERARLPLPRSFRPLAERIGSDWQQLALAGGEDYVLLFTLPAGQEPPRELGCCCIGRILRGRRVRLVQRGEKKELPALGWDHLSAGRGSQN